MLIQDDLKKESSVDQRFTRINKGGGKIKALELDAMANYENTVLIDTPTGNKAYIQYESSVTKTNFMQNRKNAKHPKAFLN
jgi:hypothetical protein